MCTQVELRGSIIGTTLMTRPAKYFFNFLNTVVGNATLENKGTSVRRGGTYSSQIDLQHWWFKRMWMLNDGCTAVRGSDQDTTLLLRMRMHVQASPAKRQ